jgi:uncharacterized membrane protein
VRSFVFIALTLLYPLAIWWGGGRVEPRWLALGLLALGAVRLSAAGGAGWRWVGAGALALGAAASVLNIGWPLKVYPVVVNGSLLALFGATLWRPPSMIERLARLTTPNLPAHAVAYTRKVTMVWCGFFVVNGAIAAATVVWGSDASWALYNGGIAYGAMGALFGGELLVRQLVKRRHAAGGAS